MHEEEWVHWIINNLENNIYVKENKKNIKIKGYSTYIKGYEYSYFSNQIFELLIFIKHNAFQNIESKVMKKGIILSYKPFFSICWLTLVFEEIRTYFFNIKGNLKRCICMSKHGILVNRAIAHSVMYGHNFFPSQRCSTKAISNTLSIFYV